MWLLGPGAAWAQVASSAPASDQASPSFLVTRVDFIGNSTFSDEQLALHVRTRANRRFLGIPGFTWWLWLYRLGESGTLGRRGGEALMASGEPPAVLDPSVVAADVERLRLFYRQEGFRQAEVTARIDTVGSDRVQVAFVIDRGAPTFLRRVSYEGLDALDAAQQLRVARGTLLRPLAVDPSNPLQFRVRSQRYSEPVLHEERRRLLTLLRDAGYAAVSRDSIQAVVYPQSPDSFDIVFQVRTGPRFRFGDVAFEVTGPEEEAPPRADSFRVAPPDDARQGGWIYFQSDDEGRLDPDILLRTLRFRPGQWYDQSSLLATKRRLEATGLFVFSDILPLVGDTARVNGVLRLPHRIELRTRRRHQIRVETFMLQRSSVIGGADSELGTGLGLSYENANLFGSGEAFRLSTTGSIAAELSDLFDRSDDASTSLNEGLFTSAQAEISASLTYPYLFGPFQRLEQAFNLYDARTRLSLSLLTARRADLGLVIRGRGTGRFRLEMQHTPTIFSLVDVLDVSLSNPDTLADFGATFLDTLLLPVRDPFLRAQITEDYTQPQINSAFRYTFRSARLNPLRRERGYSYEASVELGSNLIYLLDRFVFSPGTVEGSLPGLPFFREAESDSRLAYRQYVRLVTDLRRYHPLDRRTVLAVKLLGGIAHPTGRANVVPFDRRFYSGGASSVRGWGLRNLGPGAAAFVPDSSAVSGEAVTNLLGGDVKLEASAELRHRVLRNVLGADWIGVVFTDAGNVWFGPRNPGFGEGVDARADGRFRFDTFYRELGVGSGLGIRAAWEYLVVRFDLAARLYDPRQRGEGFLPDGLARLQPHFGIGHTF